RYLLPLAHGPRELTDLLLAEKPQAVIARLHGDGEDGILFDASFDENFQKELLGAVSRRKAFKGSSGEIICYPGGKFRRLLSARGTVSPSEVLQADQSNTSILYGDTFFLKLYRKIDEGPNPDLEIIRFLTEKTAYTHIPPCAGALEYRRRGSPSVVVGHLQGFIPNQGDFWNYTLDEVSQYFERVLTIGPQSSELPSLP
ncbi:MAG: maltose alpha-D-glucosyltransferase, partial [Thermodesulfovibrionales bacterium]